MKILKTYNELFEEDNFTSDTVESQYFLDDDGKLDEIKWEKTWTISTDPKYTKLITPNSGWILYEFPQLEPDNDESPSFYEIEWKIDGGIFVYEVNGFGSLGGFVSSDNEEKMMMYIMFDLLEDMDIKISWFIEDDESIFNLENANKYDKYFDYMIVKDAVDKIKLRKKYKV